MLFMYSAPEQSIPVEVNGQTLNLILAAPCYGDDQDKNAFDVWEKCRSANGFPGSCLTVKGPFEDREILLAELAAKVTSAFGAMEWSPATYGLYQDKHGLTLYFAEAPDTALIGGITESDPGT